jgi:hypothetical protein
MNRKRFREEQIIAVLREHVAGDLAGKHGVSEATQYNWKAKKYGGMDVSDAKRLKALENENAKLKELLADQMLEVVALKELLSKMVGSAAWRETVAYLQAVMGLSERRACFFVGADRKMIRYRSRRPAEAGLRGRLRDLANERRRFGYRQLFILLRREGETSGINRIWLYREEGLTVRKRCWARRRAVGTRAPILVEARPKRAGRSTSSTIGLPAVGASVCSTSSMT